MQSWESTYHNVKGLSPIEKAILTKSPFIKFCDDDLLSKTLNVCAVLVGITPNNMPTQTSFMVMLPFLRKYFGRFTLTELYTAFELDVSGYYGESTQHFQSFGSQYISLILNRFKSVAEEKREFIERKYVEMPSLMNQIEYKADWTDYIKFLKEKRKDGSLVPDLCLSSVYDFLVESGKLKSDSYDDPFLSEKAFDILKQEQYSILERDNTQKNRDDYMQLKSGMVKSNSDLASRIIRKQKQLAVFYYL